MQNENEQTLNELQDIFDRDQEALETELKKTQVLLKEFQDEGQGSIVFGLKESHEQEMKNMNNIMQEWKQQAEEESKSLKKQRDEAVDKADKLDQNLKKLKLQLKTTQTLQEHNSKILYQKLEKAKLIFVNN